MSKQTGRPVKYRKLFNQYKKTYAKEVARLMKLGEAPKGEQLSYRGFKTVIEGERESIIERKGSAPRRSRIISRVVQKDVFGNVVSQKQIKEYREMRSEQLKNEIENLRNEAAQIVDKARKENRLDAIEIEAKYRNDLEKKEEELKKLQKSNATELRLELDEYLKDLYKKLKSEGYVPKEAGKWISQNVFGSN